MPKKWKPALLWSTLVTLLIGGLQVWVWMRRDGLSFRDAATEVWWWLSVWPSFFLMFWLFMNWRDLLRRKYEADAASAVRRALAHPTASLAALCPKCGSANPPVAVVCVGCGHRLREVEATHVLETLPGARESAPSVLYGVAALLGGFVAVYIIDLINPKLLEKDWLGKMGFLLGAVGGLLAASTGIRAWANRRARPQSGRS